MPNRQPLSLIGEVMGKRQAHHDIDTSLIKEGQLFLRIAEKFQFHARGQHAQRVRLERQHDDGTVSRLHALPGQFQHGPVSCMYAVEIPDGHHRVGQSCAVLEALQHPHSCKTRAASFAK